MKKRTRSKPLKRALKFADWRVCKQREIGPLTHAALITSQTLAIVADMLTWTKR